MAMRMMEPGAKRRAFRVEREYRAKVQRQREADRVTPRETVGMEPPPREHINGEEDLMAIVASVNVFRNLLLPEESRNACAPVDDLSIEQLSHGVNFVDGLSPNETENYTAAAPAATLARAGIWLGRLVECGSSRFEFHLWRDHGVRTS